LRTTARKTLSAAQERVYERAARIPRSSVHTHSGGFVDEQQVVVFVKNLQRDEFGLGTKGPTWHNFHYHPFTATKLA
jgi:hypothetical protein